jgi:hypothetical protein
MAVSCAAQQISKDLTQVVCRSRTSAGTSASSRYQRRGRSAPRGRLARRARERAGLRAPLMAARADEGVQTKETSNDLPCPAADDDRAQDCRHLVSSTHGLAAPALALVSTSASLRGPRSIWRCPDFPAAFATDNDVLACRVTMRQRDCRARYGVFNQVVHICSPLPFRCNAT